MIWLNDWVAKFIAYIMYRRMERKWHSMLKGTYNIDNICDGI